MEDAILVRGAREHNLKNIDVTIPKNKLVVFTGISGSGKSSLAFDTLYAEGQRRYVESLSSYARQFLGIMDKPDVDSISGLSPAISIDQKATSHNPRSTIGTITEIYDYLRLLYARTGHPHCPNCAREISYLSKEQIVESIKKLIAERFVNTKPLRFLLLAPLIKDRKGEYSQLFTSLLEKGFSRLRVDKELFSLNQDLVLIKTNKHSIEAVVDRFSLTKKKELEETRLNSSVETALKLSEGEIIISLVSDSSFAFPDKPKKMEDFLFSEKFACPYCNISLGAIEPRTFSFNSPHGACPTCAGIGSLLRVDEDLVLAPGLTIDEGSIVPFAKMFENDTWFARIVRTVCRENNINTKTPLRDFSKEQKEILLKGTGERVYEVEGTNRQGRSTVIYEEFPGIFKELERRHRETDSDFIRLEIEKFMRQEICPECQGTRLKKEALAVTINDKNIDQFTKLAIDEALSFIKSLQNNEGQKLSLREETIAKPIFKELSARLKFLVDVGLNYLTLNRSAQSLSGGEAQRIRLASQIGSGLSGILYVLDEPSVGLHQRDNQKLITTLKNLRDLGNSVLVVEHDRETMENADLLYDFGPLAGEKGGHITASGTPSEIKRNSHSLTGQYLSGKRKITSIHTHSVILGSEATPESKNNGFWASQNDEKLANNILTITGASHHNLKNIDVEFPLGKLICVTGVSGSGKSTLINDILYHALALEFNPYHRIKPGQFQKLSGQEDLNRVVMVDQSPIGRTPRSNPATYTGAFTYIRDLFSQTKEAKIRGYGLGRFSFNVKGGRCETCEGEGQIKIEMQFLPDVYVDCETCGGKRYNDQTLEVIYRGKNISEILNMTVDEAVNFFAGNPTLLNKLVTLAEVGLGYIKLGQPAPQLSGGEAQRIKLAAELSKRGLGKALYLLDEPTTGLHFADLEKLIFVLKSLVTLGNTVIVIEHNLDLIKNADWLIDLGPEGGEAGGFVVATGTPKEVSENKNSYTGKFLHDILK
ncbi:excinuclease ABC subunit UvrA [Candidatus Gottesmanbacteria bacterium]|nr:excinuclease ABC subunit UvrA [Candidatus Gottesmanbacteria bacterium]